MANLSRIALLFFTNAILGAAIIVFAIGFFPYKAVLPGVAQWPDTTSAEAAASIAQFDKVIFMVVDALRSDFVYSNASNFHFTQSLIRSGAAMPFTGHASPPTITMPRVKAITTGSVPSFLDLVLNFAESDTSSSLASQDSWLAQLRAQPGGKLIMYGDDTWLRLFPGFFERADGTTSFFVSDFTEVDNNVTRHIPEELTKDDWTGMVMHFLGLDHIGHKTGPKGPNMPGKQLEMDGIVQTIYEAMETKAHLQSTLLVLLGDHGMNEAGNHGANSAGEVSTALTLIAPKLKQILPGQASPARYSDDFKYYDLVDQSDIAPTLAALLGLPIPRNSLGAIIPRVLDLWTNKTDRYSLLYRNAEQIQQVASATYPDAFGSISTLTQCMDRSSLSEPQLLACKWLQVKDMYSSMLSNDFLFIRDSTPLVRSFVKDVQDQLSGTASKYDLGKMQVGIGLALLSLILSLWSSWNSVSSNTFSGISFGFITCMYSITMFATSYVEEEHQFWYWTSSAWLVSLAIKQQRLKPSGGTTGLLGASMIPSLLFGTVRRWNQTGQKYAGEADLVSEVISKNVWILWTLMSLTYITIGTRLHSKLARKGTRLGFLPVLVVASAFVFKAAFTKADAPELLRNMVILRPVLASATKYPLTSLARVTFLGIGNLLATAWFVEKPWIGGHNLRSFLETLHDIISLFLVTQTRTVNIPTFLLFDYQARVLGKGRALGQLEVVITMLLLQHSSFFALGGTNAISSVDLSNAYNGISDYNILAVGVLTFVSNWAGPVWWASAAACVLRTNIQSTTRFGRFGEFNFFGALTLFASVGVLAVMAACTVLREHLFIWTVFSPKYLYTIAWTFGQHMVVNGIFSGIISAGG